MGEKLHYIKRLFKCINTPFYNINIKEICDIYINLIFIFVVVIFPDETI